MPMNANRQTINIEPELTLLDRSDMESIGLFNRFVLEQAGIVQTLLPTDDVVKVSPPARKAPERQELNEHEQQREKATNVIRGLLTAAHNGRFIDYDPETWAMLTDNEGYMQEVHKLQGMDNRNPLVEDQRRRVAVTGLGIYAARVVSYQSQPAELFARDTEDFIEEAERIPLIVEPTEILPEPA